jgi:hypothetical protein
MRRLLVCLVATVPVLVAPASASKFTPLAVTELLSRSYVMDMRCRFLQSFEHDELARFVDHARLAATEIEGAAPTRQALERGRVSAEAAECTPVARQQTVSTLLAARRAMAAPGEEEQDESGSADDVSFRQETAPEERLTVYEQRMGAYLLDRRCRHLSHRDAKKFWALVVEDQKAVAGDFGVEAVRVAKKRAERFSSSQKCNSQSEQIVQGEYRSLAGLWVNR